MVYSRIKLMRVIVLFSIFIYLITPNHVLHLFWHPSDYTSLCPRHSLERWNAIVQLKGELCMQRNFYHIRCLIYGRHVRRFTLTIIQARKDYFRELISCNNKLRNIYLKLLLRVVIKENLISSASKVTFNVVGTKDKSGTVTRRSQVCYWYFQILTSPVIYY